MKESGPSSYLICATPRTGSTHLCSLLASTGVAGRPKSYFRQPDQAMWAGRLGVAAGRDGAIDRRTFVAAALAAGRTPNGVFGARVMWGSLETLVDGLEPQPRTESGLVVLHHALGPLVFVHLRRRDVVAQAVSWARAEQTGHWQHGDEATSEPHLAIEMIEELVATIREHDTVWNAWFADQGVRPTTVTYEQLDASPGDVIRRVLDAIGVDPPPDWRPASPHTKQADAINADWVLRYHEHRG